MIAFVIIGYAITTWLLTIAEIYAVAELSDTGTHDYEDHRLTIVFQILSITTFIIAQLCMLYFFIHRLHHTFHKSLDISHDNKPSNKCIIRSLKTYFVLFVTLLISLPVIYFTNGRKISTLMNILITIWFVCYISLMLILVVLYLRRTSKMIQSEFECYVQSSSSVSENVDDQQSMIHTNEIQMSVKYGLLAVFPLVSTCIIMLLSLVLVLVYSTVNVSSIQQIDGLINSVCMLLLLQSNHRWYLKLCARCHACQEKYGLWSAWKGEDEVSDMQRSAFTELVIR